VRDDAGPQPTQRLPADLDLGAVAAFREALAQPGPALAERHAATIALQMRTLPVLYAMLYVCNPDAGLSDR
jgi:hypothetical protein